MLGFSGWMFVGTISNTFSSQGITMLMNIFFGPVHNAARAVSQQVCAAVNNFASNFMIAVRPQIVKSYSCGDEAYMYKLVFISSKVSFYLLFVLALPVLLQTEYIMSLWLEEVPEYSGIFVQLAIVEVLITSSYAPVASVSQASGKIKYYQLIISVGFLLIFALTLLFYKLGFPSYVTYIVAILIAFLGLIARLFELKKTVNFPMKQYLTEVTLRLFPVVAFSTILPVLCVYFTTPSFIHFIYIVVLSVFSVSLMFWLLGLNFLERQLIRTKLKQKFIKK
jgi:O-antigen/teichoic acid export membrane protein